MRFAIFWLEKPEKHVSSASHNSDVPHLSAFRGCLLSVNSCPFFVVTA